MTDKSSSFTRVELRELDDMAASNGVEGMEARFARASLGCETIGLSLQRLAPGAQQPFAHRHGQDEEVYVVTAGSGRAVIDGASVPLSQWSAVRVAPGAVRAFEAGDDGLEYLAFGAHTDDDGEMVPAPWGT